MQKEYFDLFIHDLKEYGLSDFIDYDTPDMHANIKELRSHIDNVEKGLINGEYIEVMMELIRLTTISCCLFERVNIMNESIGEDDAWCYQRCWACGKPIAGDRLGTPFATPLYCEKCEDREEPPNEA